MSADIVVYVSRHRHRIVEAMTQEAASWMRLQTGEAGTPNWMFAVARRDLNDLIASAGAAGFTVQSRVKS